ncbi:MAG: AAA family ATPase [Acidimicrobiales bacterium]
MTAEATDRSSATFSDLFDAVADNVARVIQGKRDVIELIVLCMVAQGHLLIEDAPGVGKTSLAKALSRSVDASFGRIQFTPDLLPSDVIGVTVWNRHDSSFEFRPGPIFANIVLADEINRASPKTQAALLESMAERQVTTDGQTTILPEPFMVIATQNPIEHEGTYPLPESQLDRFLMRIAVGYPSRTAELDILRTHGGHSTLDDLAPVVDRSAVNALAEAARHVHVSEPVQQYIVDLADASRRHPQLALGISPRASLNLQRVGRARAARAGRDFVLPDDIKAIAGPVLSHRLLVRPEAQLSGVSAASVLEDILRQVPVPAGPSST